MKEQFIITIKAEDRPGLLNLLTGIINRKQLEMDSLSAARTAISSVVMVSIELRVSSIVLQNLLPKLENIIEVYAVEAVKATEALCLQVAYFKLDKAILDTPQNEVMRKAGVNLVNVYPGAILLSMAGSGAAIRKTYKELEGPHLLGFMQSGLIAQNSLIGSDDARVITDEERIWGMAA